MAQNSQRHAWIREAVHHKLKDIMRNAFNLRLSYRSAVM
jgi:glutamate dehydrogenase/leucine dehydrogenase